MARTYAPLATVPAVPMTPMRPPDRRRTAARAPGSITPMTGTGDAARSASSACAVLVLQAMTTAFTFCPSSQREDLETVAPHRLGRLGAVGHPRRVTEVDRRFGGKALEDRVDNGEAAEARIEDADRELVHGTGMGKVTLAATPPPRTGLSARSPGKSQRCAETYASRPANEVIHRHDDEPVLVLLALVGHGASVSVRLSVVQLAGWS